MQLFLYNHKYILTNSVLNIFMLITNTVTLHNLEVISHKVNVLRISAAEIVNRNG